MPPSRASTPQSMQVTPYDYHDDSKLKLQKSDNILLCLTRQGRNIFISIVAFILLCLLITSNVLKSSHYTPKLNGLDNVSFFDLANYAGSPNGWQYDERVLFCVPLRDAAAHLPMFFNHMKKLTYPHNLIDLAFLVSDSKDDTMGN